MLKITLIYCTGIEAKHSEEWIFFLQEDYQMGKKVIKDKETIVQYVMECVDSYIS